MAKPIVQKIIVEADDALAMFQKLEVQQQELTESTREAMGLSRQATDVNEAEAHSIDKVGDESNQTARQVDKLGDETKQTGRQARTASGEQRRLARETDRVGDESRKTSREVGKLDGSLGKMFGAMTAGLGVGALTERALRLVAEAALQAHENIVKLEGSVRNLSANVGGDLVDKIIPDVNRIAQNNALGVEGRNELFETLAAVTDAEPSQTKDTLVREAEQFAQLQRATGVTGNEAFGVVRALQFGLDVNREQAVDRAAVLLNSGFAPQSLQDISEKSAAAGGGDFMALLFAARDKIDPTRTSRSIPTLQTQLLKLDAEGNVSDELQAVGITEGMSLVERIAQIDKVEREKTHTKTQVDLALGGAVNRKLFGPLAESLPDLPQARKDLASGSAEGEIEKLLASRVVRVAERQRQRELGQQAASEGFDVGVEAVELVGDRSELFREIGSGNAFIGFFKSIVDREATFNARKAIRDRRREAGLVEGPAFSAEATREALVDTVRERVAQGQMSQDAARDFVQDYDRRYFELGDDSFEALETSSGIGGAGVFAVRQRSDIAETVRRKLSDSIGGSENPTPAITPNVTDESLSELDTSSPQLPSTSTSVTPSETTPAQSVAPSETLPASAVTPASSTPLPVAASIELPDTPEAPNTPAPETDPASSTPQVQPTPAFPTVRRTPPTSQPVQVPLGRQNALPLAGELGRQSDEALGLASAAGIINYNDHRTFVQTQYLGRDPRLIKTGRLKESFG